MYDRNGHTTFTVHHALLLHHARSKDTRKQCNCICGIESGTVLMSAVHDVPTVKGHDM